jgi:hypothetical protein
MVQPQPRPRTSVVCSAGVPGGGRGNPRRKPVNQRGWARVCAAVVVGSAGLWGASIARADEWKPITPEELKLKILEEAPGAPAVILYKEVLKDDGRIPHEDTYIRIKILTDEGRKYANVEIPYFKDAGAVHGIRARTVRPDGSVVVFDGKAIDQTIVKAKGVKILAKTFTLPNVQAGSIIEYHYTIDYNGLYESSRWILSDELFTKYAKFGLKASPDYALRWSWPARIADRLATP